MDDSQRENNIIKQIYPRRRRVFLSTSERVEGNSKMKMVLGGKGANIAEMKRLGIPVPPALTIDTRTNLEYLRASSQNIKKLPQILIDEYMKGIRAIESETENVFGDKESPLLVSVRSGAAESMPGMMDTILNLGLNDETIQGLIAKTGDERFAYDSYRRFIQMFSDVVLGIEKDKFEAIIHEKKSSKGNRKLDDTLLSADDWKEIINQYKFLVEKETGKPFPQDVHQQLQLAITAVFSSWNNDRAIQYRRIHRITEEMANGTAVNVQAMVFGNTGNESGTGVIFTRNPNTGEVMYDEDDSRIFYGDFLINAQGEDVVAGIRTPIDISELKNIMPEVYQKLFDTLILLEKHYRDLQDVEFTIENKKLYMLQTRNGKRTIKAAVKSAIDATKEFGVSQAEALLRIPANEITQLLLPTFKRDKKGHILNENNQPQDVIAKGTPASIGAAKGQIVFTASDAVNVYNKAQISKEKDPNTDTDQLILVTLETSPDDIGGMEVSNGICTFVGGKTSHAAVVSRQMQTPAIVSMKYIDKEDEDNWNIDYENNILQIGPHKIKRLDWVSMDGTTGELLLGKLPSVEPELDENFKIIMDWTDEFRSVGIKANAEEEKVVCHAKQYGAEGIGLARTEHMFFHNVVLFQTMLMADTETKKEKALEKLLNIQKNDFKMIFKHMESKSVTVRLLDPPIHEFLPKKDTDKKLVADALGLLVKDIDELASKMHESNPMLGTRGVRLLLKHPEIPVMQVRAIIRAAFESKNEGVDVKPEIMIPLVNDVEEFIAIKNIINPVIDEESKKFEMSRDSLDLKIGTMIELPAAAMPNMAAAIAKEADFASFGTNDLTQTVMGLSRDDTTGYISNCIENGIYKKDPFEVLHPSVKELIEQCIVAMKQANPDIVIGICGEHGGDPDSIAFLNSIYVDTGLEQKVKGVDYVSMSPSRIPGGKVAAAQAELMGSNLD
ncbi:pyruvate phosphate dikinase [Candidatus Magnetomorum sp. HK-1]|nr:pyruvate phosphate dikinase [Candidatus Magnetomorum sp. HK-1]